MLIQKRIASSSCFCNHFKMFNVNSNKQSSLAFGTHIEISVAEEFIPQPTALAT